ncbi:uncharacterized protein LOC135489956 [Lineus longissimus]
MCHREKKAGGRKFNRRALTYEDTQRINTFLINFAEQYALVLPGRVPGFKRADLKLLPSCETKVSIWRKYCKAVTDLGHRTAKLSAFKSVWKSVAPHIVKTKPMTDLCGDCQLNNYKIYRSANLPNCVKDAKLRKQEEHLRIVEQERDVLRAMTNEAKKTVAELGIVTLSASEPCSKDISMHYSFDFAQQVHYPYSPYQPGPIYFLTPRKCAIFGVCCEALPQQINYLIDEGMASSKGSNAVISYVHHFLGNYGLGEKHADLHCDNCSGQNKNKFVVWYLLWRVMNGYHDSITMNFLIAGHTKFAPDWCFGLFKQRFRRCEMNTLNDIADAVTTSANANRPQLVGNEQGESYVNMYDWQEFLKPFFKPLDGIKSLHVVRFDSRHPGVVFTKELSSDTVEKAVQLLKNVNHLPPRELPTRLKPPGLDFARQKYLFDKIRDYCMSEDSKDIVCPKPVAVAAADDSSDGEEYRAPPQKKGRKK